VSCPTGILLTHELSYRHIALTCTNYYCGLLSLSISGLSRYVRGTCRFGEAWARLPFGWKNYLNLRCVSLLVYDSETRRLEAVVLIVETRKRGWCRAAPVRGRTGGRALLLRSNLRD
jgi:hypothetical protein